MKINKKNIKKIILDVEGSSFIRFETDLELKQEALGDFYWQGDGKYFEINAYDFLNDREEEFEGELDDYLSKDAKEYLRELFNDDLGNMI